MLQIGDPRITFSRYPRHFRVNDISGLPRHLRLLDAKFQGV